MAAAGLQLQSSVSCRAVSQESSLFKFKPSTGSSAFVKTTQVSWWTVLFFIFFLIAFLQFCFFVIEFAYLLIFYLKSHCNHQHHMIILFWYTLCSSGLLIILFLLTCYASGLFIKSILFLLGYSLLYYFYWFECKFTILRTTVTNDTICCAEY